MFELANRTAIVTGAGSRNGIGRATALALAGQGADVAVCDLNQAGVNETVAEIRKLGRRALGFVAGRRGTCGGARRRGPRRSKWPATADRAAS